MNRSPSRRVRGDDFLARLCRRWEDAARDAEPAGHARGPAAHRGGARPCRRRPGAAAAAVRAGRGRPGRIRQPVPAVDSSPRSREDHRRGAGRRSLSRAGERGGAGTGDQPRRSPRALGRALHRPAVLPVPAFALKAIFGEAAAVLLASQRAEPRALQERQFAFDYPTLADGACRHRRRHAGRDLRRPGRNRPKPGTPDTSCGREPSSMRRSSRRSRSSRRPRTSG